MIEEEHYEVWVTLEKWKGDDKREDCETTKIADILKREDGELVWELCEAAALSITPIIANNCNLSILD